MVAYLENFSCFAFLSRYATIYDDLRMAFAFCVLRQFRVSRNEFRKWSRFANGQMTASVEMVNICSIIFLRNAKKVCVSRKWVRVSRKLLSIRIPKSQNWRFAIYELLRAFAKEVRETRNAPLYQCGLLRYATICDDLRMTFAFSRFATKYEITMAKCEIIILPVW